LGALLCLVVVGCSESEVLVIDASNEWSADIYARTLDQHTAGAGPARITLPEGHTCWVVQKSTADGTLRVYMEMQGIIGADRGEEQSTDKPFGTVDGCNR
jgi:hypothetical protein